MVTQAQTPMIIGHRGAPGYRPEHTAAAYRLAFELGANAVEPDIVATQDGVLVLRHENEISGTTDVADRPEFRARKSTKVIDGVKLSGWFTEDFTWAELATLRARERLAKHRPESASYDGKYSILRLRDLLAIIDEESERHQRALSVVIELKHAAYFRGLGLPLDRLLVEELHSCGWETRAERIILESFELGVLDDLRDAGLEAHYVFLMESQGAPADEVLALGAAATSYAEYRTDAGLARLSRRVDGISVAKRELFLAGGEGPESHPNDLVARAHALGLTVYVWTLRPENGFLHERFRMSRNRSEWGDWQGEFQFVLDSGVDGIFVDHPDLGASAVQDFAPGA